MPHLAGNVSAVAIEFHCDPMGSSEVFELTRRAGGRDPVRPRDVSLTTKPMHVVLHEVNHAVQWASQRPGDLICLCRPQRSRLDTTLHRQTGMANAVVDDHSTRGKRKNKMTKKQSDEILRKREVEITGARVNKIGREHEDEGTKTQDTPRRQQYDNDRMMV